MPNLKLKLKNSSTAEEIRIALAILNLNQEEIAKELKVTPAAISLAIANDPQVRKLRKNIINRLNQLQGFIRRAS